MQDTGFETTTLDFNDVFDQFDFSTPLASQNENPSSLSGEPESGEDEPCPLYTMTWKLQLRKGRVSKLTEDTIEDLDIAPGAYWNEVLQPELAILVQSKLPEPQYQPDETTITVLNSKRGETPFLKRFDKLTINWSTVENKLRSWSNHNSTLKIAISFIYKESQPSNKDGKVGRGATRKHTAALEKLVARQEASGTRPVWKDVYQVFECNSAACTNRGFSCWRYNDKHYKLDSDIMERLVDCAEEGHKLETHADVPEAIRELIVTRDSEDSARKRRKRKADPLPITVHVTCPGQSSPAKSLGEGQPMMQLNIQPPEDEAPKFYSDWLEARVKDQSWRAATRLAGEVTVAKGYDLQWLYTNQKAGRDMLEKSGVLEGVAARYVSWIPQWVQDVYTD